LSHAEQNIENFSVPTKSGAHPQIKYLIFSS